jgi:plastocyanin
MRLYRVAALTFVVVLIAVLGSAALAGMMTAESTEFDSPEHVEVDNPQFSSDRISGDYDPGEANIQMESNVSEKKIVIKTGILVTEHDIQPLVSTLIQEGHEVVIHGANQANLPVFPRSGFEARTQIGPPGPGPGPGGQQKALGDRLEDAHAFVSIGVGNYQPQDIEAIKNFANDEGRVLMAVNPSHQYSFSQSTTNLFSKLGVYTGPGYVYNMEDNDQNFQRIFAQPTTGESNLTDGLDQVMLSTATAVQTVSNETLLRPTDGAELSTTRGETNAGLMVRNDSTVLVGDTRFMTPTNTLRADNDKFVGNIADFLVTGNRTLESDNGGQPGDGEVVVVEVGPGGQPVFEPQELEIEPGTTVRFEWKSDGYNIVPEETPPGVQWEGVSEPKDEGYVYEFTFEKEGVYVFISGPHEDQGMIAGIIVGNP